MNSDELRESFQGHSSCSYCQAIFLKNEAMLRASLRNAMQLLFSFLILTDVLNL